MAFPSLLVCWNKAAEKNPSVIVDSVRNEVQNLNGAMPYTVTDNRELEARLTHKSAFAFNVSPPMSSKDAYTLQYALTQKHKDDNLNVKLGRVPVRIPVQEPA